MTTALHLPERTAGRLMRWYYRRLTPGCTVGFFRLRRHSAHVRLEEHYVPEFDSPIVFVLTISQSPLVDEFVTLGCEIVSSHHEPKVRRLRTPTLADTTANWGLAYRRAIVATYDD